MKQSGRERVFLRPHPKRSVTKFYQLLRMLGAQAWQPHHVPRISAGVDPKRDVRIVTHDRYRLCLNHFIAHGVTLPFFSHDSNVVGICACAISRTASA